MEKEVYFVIECRYEVFTKQGKDFTKWFVYDSTKRTKDESETHIKEIQKNFGFIDTKTKLKHEYRLLSYTEYVNHIENLKDNVKVLEEKQKEYLKSDEYKELCRKKRISAKERKENQKKYLEEHNINIDE